MKARRNLYIILGVLATFFYFGGLYLLFMMVKRVTPAEIKSFNYNLLSGQLWSLIAVLLFRAAYRVQQKINRQKRQSLENAFTD